MSPNFICICNNRIGKDLLWPYAFHLTDEGTSFLVINFLHFLNSFHKHGNLSDLQPNLSKSMNPKPEIQNTTLKGTSKLHNNYISRFKMIKAENFDNFTVATLNINYILFKFDEF